MRRTITGRTDTGPMTLGDLRRFVGSLDALPDEAVIKARTRFARRTLRSITVEEDDDGFKDYIRAVGRNDPDNVATRKAREAKEAKEKTPV